MKKIRKHSELMFAHNAFRSLALMMLLALSANASAQSSDYERSRSSDERDRYEERYDDRGEQRDSRYDERTSDRYGDHRDGRRKPSYRYCKDRAYDITGYRGASPSRYREGGALEGAIKGGLNAGAASWVTGGDKKEIRKARKRGAQLGFIIGALKQGSEREKQRKNDRLRREFDYEIRACMRDY